MSGCPAPNPAVAAVSNRSSPSMPMRRDCGGDVNSGCRHPLRLVNGSADAQRSATTGHRRRRVPERVTRWRKGERTRCRTTRYPRDGGTRLPDEVPPRSTSARRPTPSGAVSPERVGPPVVRPGHEHRRHTARRRTTTSATSPPGGSRVGGARPTTLPGARLRRPPRGSPHRAAVGHRDDANGRPTGAETPAHEPAPREEQSRHDDGAW